MGRWVDVGAMGDLADGMMKALVVEGRELLVARAGDAYYAADERCPHLAGHLARGRLEGTIITCPRHHSRFDLIDGRVLRWTDWQGLKLAAARLFKPARPLRTYPVRVDSGRILVELEGTG